MNYWHTGVILIKHRSHVHVEKEKVKFKFLLNISRSFEFCANFRTCWKLRQQQKSLDESLFGISWEFESLTEKFQHFSSALCWWHRQMDSKKFPKRLCLIVSQKLLRRRLASSHLSGFVLWFPPPLTLNYNP